MKADRRGRILNEIFAFASRGWWRSAADDRRQGLSAQGKSVSGKALATIGAGRGAALTGGNR
jgi:hypothetical protein